jgi:hypothetical protein
MSYPKWLYHAEQEARIVKDAAAHASLGAGWLESPAEFPASEPGQEKQDSDAPNDAPKKRRGRGNKE